MSEPIYPDSIDKIQDFVTRPPEDVEDIDGAGHHSISPIGFPSVDFSENDNPTKVVPEFKVTYKDPKSYPEFPEYSEEGEVVAINPYIFDGTENDNKLGTYPENPDENHLRNSYSDKEITDFLRSNLNVQLQMGKFSGILHNWFFGNTPVNIGGSHSIFVSQFGLNMYLGEPNPEPLNYVITPDDSDVTIDAGGDGDYIIDANG